MKQGFCPDETKRDLNGILAGDEQHFGGRQIVVATLKSLQGYEIEDYGYQLGRAWGIGQKGKNNGALIIVAPTEHKVRIEVGYGLEGDLTDAKSRVIIDQYMKPDFKKGDYNAGVLEGTKAVLATLGNKNFAAPDYDQIAADEQAPSGWSTGLIVLVLIFFFLGRSWFWPLLFLGGMGGGRGGWGGGGGWSSGGGGGGFLRRRWFALAAGARPAVGRRAAHSERSRSQARARRSLKAARKSTAAKFDFVVVARRAIALCALSGGVERGAVDCADRRAVAVAPASDHRRWRDRQCGAVCDIEFSAGTMAGKDSACTAQGEARRVQPHGTASVLRAPDLARYRAQRHDAVCFARQSIIWRSSPNATHTPPFRPGRGIRSSRMQAATEKKMSANLPPTVSSPLSQHAAQGSQRRFRHTSRKSQRSVAGPPPFCGIVRARG